MAGATLRDRTVSRHEWLPKYQVTLKHKEVVIPGTMIVDSGADFSVISLKNGRYLGYRLADGEELLVAQTLGGSVE